MSKGASLRQWLLLIFLSVIWGTSFILIKRSLLAFSPVEVAILRVSLSGVAFLPFFLKVFKKLEWERWWFYLIISLTGSGIPAILYAKAQTQLSSATSGILNSLTPVFALIIGIIFFRNKTTKLQIFGTILGFLGASTLIALDQPLDPASYFESYIFSLLIVAGTLFYATNVNLVKSYLQNVDPIQLSSFAFVLLGIPILLLVPFTNIPSLIVNHPDGMNSFLSVTFLAVISTAMSLILFYKLVQETDAVFGSSVAYLIPIVAIAWGTLDGEYIAWMHYLSMAVILIGVYLIRS